MNFTKQNNPVVIVALIAILVGALAFVFTQIKHAQAAMAAHAAVAPAAPQESQQAQPAGRSIVDSYTRPAFANDPFKAPILKDTQPPGPQPHRLDLPLLPAASTMPLTIQPIPGMSSHPGAKPDAKAASDPDTDVIKTFRVTAVMKGERATAIIERAGVDPIAVGVGEKVGAYKVAAINDDGVVLTSRTGIYTVSLISKPEAPTSAAAGSTADSGPSAPIMGDSPRAGKERRKASGQDSDSDSRAATDAITDALAGLAAKETPNVAQ